MVKEAVEIVREYYPSGEVFSEYYYEHGKLHREDGPAINIYYPNGNKETEIWCQDDILCRSDNLAIIKYYSEGKIRSKKWRGENEQSKKNQFIEIEYYRNGNIYSKRWGTVLNSELEQELFYTPCNKSFHRKNGPAEIIYYGDGSVCKEHWFQMFQIFQDDYDKYRSCFHRECGPASIKYYKNGNIDYEEWFVNNYLHRNDGPALVTYYSNGQINDLKWYSNGLLGRDDGPAYTHYYTDGNVNKEIWYMNEVRHRDDGPAEIIYETENDPVFYYHLNDVKVPEWLVMTPAEDLDPNGFFDLSNIEVRREFIRKAGLEKIIDTIGEVIETDNSYQLINLRITDGAYRPYLKMINPSTGDIHAEGIDSSCETVQQALNWRNGRNDRPAIIT